MELIGPHAPLDLRHGVATGAGIDAEFAADAAQNYDETGT